MTGKLDEVSPLVSAWLDQLKVCGGLAKKADAARMIGVSRQRVGQLIQEGKLNWRKIGPLTGIPVAEVIDYVLGCSDS